MAEKLLFAKTTCNLIITPICPRWGEGAVKDSCVLFKWSQENLGLLS